MSAPFLADILSACPDAAIDPQRLKITGAGALPSWFDVTGLAAATFGTAGLMLARLAEAQTGPTPSVTVDQRLASFWFGSSVRPQGWELPPTWDPIAGDYRAKDRWLRLHTNAPHHRKAALSVLGEATDRAGVEPLVARWDAKDLAEAVVEAGGCAAVMHDLEEWAHHPQGAAVAAEPLVHRQKFPDHESRWTGGTQARPLEGLKVLDLTRVLAGPVAGRFLAAYGAKVLRVDPPDWDEPNVAPDVTLGKRCTRLDIKTPDGRAAFEKLLVEADVMLHGYRRDALEKLGYGADALRFLNPALIDVSLNAYGHTGPWATRRGFDSLVQMSSGIADYGMRMAKADKPTPLPVQALDMATGYLMAAAMLDALYQNRRSSTVISAKLSLARTAHLLVTSKRGDLGPGIAAEADADLAPQIEDTGWGPARRPYWPVAIAGIEPSWPYPARGLGWSGPCWG